MQTTSLSLMERIRTRPLHEDWSRLVAIYRPFVERFVRLDPGLAADADDIVQEVMRKLVKHLPSFQRQRDGSFRKWLKTVTVNEVNLHGRKRSQRKHAREIADPSLLEALLDPRDAMSERWDREHNQHVLQQLLLAIEPEFAATTWRAFQLRVLEDRSTTEVAAVLGISKNAVDIAKSRVLHRLRAEAGGLVDDA